jgi:hypothetical protein
LLKHFERLILSTLGFLMAPQVTPIGFIRELLFLWQPKDDHTELINLADSLVALYWEGDFD